MQIGRRDFIKYAAGLAGLIFLVKEVRLPIALVNTSEATEKATETLKRVADGLGTAVDPLKKFSLVMDVGACIGCRRCMYACKEENNIPDTISPLWIEVFEMKSDVDVTGHPPLEDLKKGATTAYTESPKPGMWYLPVQCNHCDNPPCVRVCPTGATHKEKDGFVLMDYDKCIGCRLCVVACPYNARRFNWWKPEIAAEKVNQLVPLRPLGVVEKCTFCVHRVRRGKLPRCVEVCPVQARHFGDRNDPVSEVSKILKENLGFRLLEEVNTEPNIWYITRGKKWPQ